MLWAWELDCCAAASKLFLARSQSGGTPVPYRYFSPCAANAAPGEAGTADAGVASGLGFAPLTTGGGAGASEAVTVFAVSFDVSGFGAALLAVVVSWFFAGGASTAVAPVEAESAVDIAGAGLASGTFAVLDEAASVGTGVSGAALVGGVIDGAVSGDADDAASGLDDVAV